MAAKGGLAMLLSWSVAGKEVRDITFKKVAEFQRMAFEWSGATAILVNEPAKVCDPITGP